MTDDRRPPDDLNLSSPVPFGPSSEAGAMPGTGNSAPGPVVPATGDESVPAPPAASTDLDPASDLPDQGSNRTR